MRYILALDQGTTSSRAILFDRQGLPVSMVQEEFTQIFPAPGHVEHDAAEIWRGQLAVARQAMKEAHAAPADIAAIGIANQRETTVIWDRKTGHPIHNAIVWQDRRTAAACDRLKQSGQDPLIQNKTGLLIDAYFSATKAQWLLDNVPGARARAERGELAFGTIDTWLLWNLTAGQLHATDPSNASRTMLYNIHKQTWDDDLLNLFNIPRAILPDVLPSSHLYGHTPANLFGSPLPISGIAGDQQAALFGQTCFTPGLIKNTYGTGCFLLLNTGTTPKPSRNRLLTTIAWNLSNQTSYAMEGSVFVGGAVIQWLRDGLGIIKTAAEVETLAASVQDSQGVYIVPAFAGLGAPHWDQYARGSIAGLTRGTTKAHLARAALESIAFQVADLADAMKTDTSVPLVELRADGGAAANNLLMQFQADLLRVPVVRPKVTQTTALGAAYLAGLAVKFWQSLEQVKANGAIDRVFEPALSADAAAHRRARWAQALQRSRDWEEQS
jgi:glycerol kinase